MEKYISVEAAISAVKSQTCWHYNDSLIDERGIIFNIDNIPAADVVSRNCYDRILAENDTMREMLAQIWKKPGDKMDDVRKVVRCKDCKHRPVVVNPSRPYGFGLAGPGSDPFGRDETCPYLCDDGYYNRMPDDDGFCNLGDVKDG